ncbi:XdhC family protein [Carboxylicivirga marina]|uniref:XdhC family protein n=1 Tax=Carboxylicivirga marina TaxID=2800988 RepID=A0ABS1HNY6_9BACT|nr:XdhC family protein [Carboxylicivirga marina]MBK3518869.1 XdhC family protein [Carboxylicivirga marina]
MLNIYQSLLKFINDGDSVILGTLVVKKGSAPQIPGSSAIFNAKGLLTGTLGGGILEAEAERLVTAPSAGINLFRTIKYNAKIEDDTGAICGGEASFILDFSPQKHSHVFEQMHQSLSNGLSGYLITFIEKNHNIKRYWLQEKDPISDELIKFRNDIVNCNKQQAVVTYQLENGYLMIELLQAAPRLIIIGGGHIGQALCHYGHMLGFEVTVLDNRPEYVRAEMFKEAKQLLIGDLTDSMQALKLKPDAYVVIVTQGHKTDYAALLACLQADVAYLGMIGSKRKVKLIKEDLLKKKFSTQSELDTIYSPIGLDIGAKTVPEIALSIAAELVQVRRSKKVRNDVAMIILGAGKSSRMKQVKMLLPFNNETIIESVVQTALNSKASHTIVVTGAYEKQISQQIKHLPVKVCYNADFEQGMLSSVQCGVNNADAFEAFMVLPGDQPLVKASTIDRLIDAWRRSDKGLVIPTFNGKKGHPVLIHHRYKEQINHLDSNIGLRQLFHEHTDDILYVEIDSEEVLMDLDKPDDYKKALKWDAKSKK